jgi:hypothetical protein
VSFSGLVGWWEHAVGPSRVPRLGSDLGNVRTVRL